MTTSDSEFADNYPGTEIVRGRMHSFLVIFELIAAFAMLAYGAVILLGNIAFLLLPDDAPIFISAYGVQAFLFLILGFITFKTAMSIKDMDNYAFSWVLYINIGGIIISLTMIPFSVPLLITLVLPYLFLFMGEVRGLWWPEYSEDMGPRLKEIRYSIFLLRKSPLVVLGIIIIIIMFSLALLAPFLAPYGPEERIWEILPPGTGDHLWGTDEYGGDVFSRILWAAQTDLRIALTIVAVAVSSGTVIGAISGYYGGKIDEIVMRVTDVFFAFPGLILAMAIVMALGERSLDNISLALMITWWPTYARLVRGQVLSEREKLYVEAARSVGASDSRILLFHIIPNTIQPLIVQATMDTGGVLLTAAGLSYIGFGPPAGAAEWGLMISKGQEYLISYPWMSLYPGLAILVTALGFNLVGDGIRDILDPKLRRR